MNLLEMQYRGIEGVEDMRQIVIDTETTGLDVGDGHRLIEIACIELYDRYPTGDSFHEYINPERKIEIEAQRVHGIDNYFLETKPKFANIAASLYQFIENAELIIHNADFDLGFLDSEFERLKGDYRPIREVCTIVDTIELARKDRPPGSRVSLDALANEFNIDLSERTKHGAMVDAEILVGVYRALTGGQTSIEFADPNKVNFQGPVTRTRKKRSKKVKLVVLPATDDELKMHEQWLDYLDQESESGSVWRKNFPDL